MIGAFAKTLFGDRHNVAVVLILLAIEVALVRLGYGREGVVAVPLATMAGVVWLMRHE